MEKFYYTLNQLSIGDRIVVPKSFFNLVQHHAIFLGYSNGHYWFIENKEGHGVRKITAEVFFAGVDRITRIEKFQPKWNYSREDLARYALNKLGVSYHLTRYNCEHFANQVQHQRVESKQANVGIGLGLLAGSILLANAFSNSGSSRK